MERSRNVRSGNSKSTAKRVAPHPIPDNSAGLVCPITGLSGVDNAEYLVSDAAIRAMKVVQEDPDVKEEERTLKEQVHPARHTQDVGNEVRVVSITKQSRSVPLNIVNQAHRANSDTRRLFLAVGGLGKMRQMTNKFYEKCFADPHIDQFIRRHDDPHGERFALFLTEKFGDGTPWTNERRTRGRDTMVIGGYVESVAFDRSSAHFAAWHSPKRNPSKWGQHFKPDDARVWMRLHFWAARDVGLFEPQHAAFMDYYLRFIGHFISVYSSKAPPFTRESARWSASSKNIQEYLSSSNCMLDIIDKPVDEALRTLPSSERDYTGSSAAYLLWPYS